METVEFWAVALCSLVGGWISILQKHHAFAFEVEVFELKDWVAYVAKLQGR
jgi:hypothetical protein